MAVSEDSTVTSKGQVTIPKRIRDQLGIDAGTELEFILEENGEIRVRTKKPPMERLQQIKEKLAERDVNIDKMRRESKREWGEASENGR